MGILINDTVKGYKQELLFSLNENYTRSTNINISICNIHMIFWEQKLPFLVYLLLK